MGMSLSLQVLGEHLGLRNAKKDVFLVTRGLLWGSFGDLLGPGCHGQGPRLTYSSSLVVLGALFFLLLRVPAQVSAISRALS